MRDAAMDKGLPPDDYFATARREVLPFLPRREAGLRVLDVGCGTGATTAMLRTERAVAFAAGIELAPEAAANARPHFDVLFETTVEAADLETAIAPASLDVVFCLDILEHLSDPWAAVRRFSALLAPGGRLIVSVPNIRNYRFLFNLAVRGDFRYRDFGLLDRTHLRFFTFETACELATSGGLRRIHLASVQRWKPGDWRWFAARLTAARADAWTAKQVLVVAEA